MGMVMTLGGGDQPVVVSSVLTNKINVKLTVLPGAEGSIEGLLT